MLHSLVTNDDGISAPGLMGLALEMRSLATLRSWIW